MSDYHYSSFTPGVLASGLVLEPLYKRQGIKDSFCVLTQHLLGRLRKGRGLRLEPKRFRVNQQRHIRESFFYANF